MGAEGAGDHRPPEGDEERSGRADHGHAVQQRPRGISTEGGDGGRREVLAQRGPPAQHGPRTAAGEGSAQRSDRQVADRHRPDGSRRDQRRAAHDPGPVPFAGDGNLVRRSVPDPQLAGALAEGTSVDEATVGVARHRPQDELFHGEREVCPAAARRGWRPIEDAGEGLGGVAAGVGRLPRQRMVENGPGPVDIGASVRRRSSPNLLGRHVQGGAERDSGLGDRGVVLDASDTEVEQPRVDGAIRRPTEEHIGGFDVAVDDPRGVRDPQRVGELLGDRQSVRQRQRAGPLDVLAEILPLEELGDQHRSTVGGLQHVENVDDVG